MNQKRKRGIHLESASLLPPLFAMALLFFVGVILGQVFVGSVPDATGRELSQYLSDFIRTDTWRSQTGVRVFFLTLALYFRYPLAALLLGFASIGVILLPCTALFFGALMSFSVSCFTAAFGSDGMLLAAAVLGLRCAVTLPCYLLTAAAAWKSSAALASLSFGKGRRVVPVRCSNWRSCAIICVFLLICSCADVFLSPWFLRLALERITL